MTEDEKARLRDISNQLSKMAGNTSYSDKIESSSLSKEVRLWVAARQEIARRQAQSVHLPHRYLGEAAWNILLDLFNMEMQGKPVSITSACSASQVPATTALRYISALIDEGTVIRSQDPNDDRRAHLRLSLIGKRMLLKTLGAMIEAESRASLTPKAFLDT